MMLPEFANLGRVRRDFEWSGGAELPESSEVLEEVKSNHRPAILAATGVVCLLVLALVLFYHQIVKGGRNFLLAERNRIRLEKVPAPRGIIFDRVLRPLVRNLAATQLALVTANLPMDRVTRDAILQKVSQIAGVSLEEIVVKLEQSKVPHEPVVIKEHLSQDEALRYQTEFHELAGVEVIKIPIRSYGTEGALAHLLGYVGKPDQDFLLEHPQYDLAGLVGKAQLELVYESFLKGRDGYRKVEVDAQGRLQRVLANQPPQQGNNLVLAIDVEFQKQVENALSESLAASASKKGAVVAINPQNGEVLALVSLPSFDNNAFVTGDAKTIQQTFSSPLEPLVNRAIAGMYPSGSTVKPVWAAAALQERLIDEKFKIDTPPEIAIGEFRFPDWRDHGVSDIKTAIAESNNIFFYGLTGGWGQIRGLGIARLVDYMKKVGFGEKTGIDLTGEKAGFVPTPAWKKKTRGQPWYIGDTYHLGIGQGDIAVTPLQLLVAESAIVNGGKLVTPHVAAKITDPQDNEIQTIAPEPKRDGIFGDDARRITMAGMRQTVTAGSARQLADLPVEVLAKTGTAQFGSQGKTHAWLVAFAPYQDPQFGIIVIVEGGGEGHAVAQPVAKKALQWWFER